MSAPLIRLALRDGDRRVYRAGPWEVEGTLDAGGLVVDGHRHGTVVKAVRALTREAEAVHDGRGAARRRLVSRVLLIAALATLTWDPAWDPAISTADLLLAVTRFVLCMAWIGLHWRTPRILTLPLFVMGLTAAAYLGQSPSGFVTCGTSLIAVYFAETAENWRSPPGKTETEQRLDALDVCLLGAAILLLQLTWMTPAWGIPALACLLLIGVTAWQAWLAWTRRLTLPAGVRRARPEAQGAPSSPGLLTPRAYAHASLPAYRRELEAAVRQARKAAPGEETEALVRRGEAALAGIEAEGSGEREATSDLAGIVAVLEGRNQ